MVCYNGTDHGEDANSSLITIYDPFSRTERPTTVWCADAEKYEYRWYGTNKNIYKTDDHEDLAPKLF